MLIFNKNTFLTQAEQLITLNIYHDINMYEAILYALINREQMLQDGEVDFNSSK